MTDADNQPPTIDNSEDTSTPPISIWSIIVRLFTSPTEAMADFGRKPTIVIPLILIIILVSLTTLGTYKQSALLQYDLLQHSSLPPQALEQMRQGADSANPVTAILGGIVAVVVIGMIAALIVMFLGRVIFGGNASFIAIWGVGLLASLIQMAGGLLRIPMVYAKGTMLVSYGFAAAMPSKDFTSILYSILYYCDAFFFWALIVAGIGYGKIFGISRGKGILTAAIVYGILISLAIAMTTFGLLMAGVDISFF